MRRGRSGDLAAAVLLAAAAAAFTIGVFWHRAQLDLVQINHDAYTYFYPNLLYTLRSLRSGTGLFWNALQNCGQPAFAVATMGMLYPLHAVYLVFGPDLGQFVEIGLHLAVGGLGAYWLGRELGLRAAAALCGALAFALGGVTIGLAAWMPIILGPYAWLPAVMAACERGLRRPTGPCAVLLGVLLTVQLLPGYPQINFFTYQLIALRVAWELATRPAARRWRLLAVFAVALLLPLLLGAAQLLPSLEFARDSIRGGRLSDGELRPGRQALTWEQFRDGIRLRRYYGAVFGVVPALLAGCAVATRRLGRVAAVYAVAAALSLALAFDNPLFALYRLLPFGASFRLPHRFLWVTAFAMSVLVGFGAEAVLAAGSENTRRRVAVIGGGLAAVGAFALLSPLGVYPTEKLLLAAGAAAIAAALVWRPGLWLAAGVLPLLFIAAAFLLPGLPVFGPLRDPAVLFAKRDAFEWVKARATRQDRMYQFGAPGHFGVIPKAGSLFGIPSVTDYETQASTRFAAVSVRLAIDKPMRTINEYYFALRRRPANRPLLNLLAARFVVTDQSGAPLAGHSLPLLQLRYEAGGTRVYENLAALPRAFFVPQLYVLRDPDKVLDWIASPRSVPRQVAMVEEVPADGFIGKPASAAGSVSITEDRGEILTLNVRAPQEGFLFLSDQYYPGWQATVNGVPMPILRANYAFRAVRVPAGDSVVVFRFQSASVRIGAAVSIVTALLIAVYLGAVAVRRRHVSARPSPASLAGELQSGSLSRK